MSWSLGQSQTQGVADLPEVSNSSVAATTGTAPGWGKSLAGWAEGGVAGRTATPGGMGTATIGGMRTATMGGMRTATMGGMRTATLGQVQVAVQRVEEEEEPDPDAESFDDW